jgi:hypothetical protein
MGGVVRSVSQAVRINATVNRLDGKCPFNDVTLSLANVNNIKVTEGDEGRMRVIRRYTVFRETKRN